jgi:hypothetical protein
VEVRLARVRAAPTEVTIAIQPFGCGREHGAGLLKDLGRLLLESLRTYLQVNPERRIQERLIWPHPLLVCPLVEGRPGERIECQGKDISLSGVGFYLPCQLPTPRIRVELTAGGQEPVQVPASIARVQRCGESWFEVGALFLPTAEQQKLITELCAR